MTGDPKAGRDGYHPSLRSGRILRAWSERLDRRRGWDSLPLPVSLGVLVGLRDSLRRDNLYDPSTAVPSVVLGPPEPAEVTTRTPDGRGNDLSKPRTGMAGTRFGRNVPLSAARRPSDAEVLEPSPREISRALMTRSTAR